MSIKRNKKSIVIEVPIVLPSWNRVLAINHWGKKKFRDLTDRIVQQVVDKGEVDEYLEKEFLYLCRPSTKNKNAAASARKSKR